jgi:hypothetical protein
LLGLGTLAWRDEVDNGASKKKMLPIAESPVVGTLLSQFQWILEKSNIL